MASQKGSNPLENRSRVGPNPLKITLGDQWLAIFPAGENPGEHPKRTDLAFQHLAFGSDFKNWEKSRNYYWPDS